MRYLIALLLLIGSAAHAFDASLMEGQWAAHLKPQEDPEHYLFLSFNGDHSGVLVRRIDDQAVTRTFSAGDIIVRTGYLEVKLADNETAILWAWKRNDGLRRVNGLLFEPGSEQSVRNMLPVPLEFLTDEHALRKDPYIAELLRRYPWHDGGG